MPELPYATPDDPDFLEKMRRMACNAANLPYIEWPPNVNPITLDQLVLLGIDGEQRLHWNGRPIQIEKKVTLSLWQNLLAALAAAGAVAQGVMAVLSYLHRS